MKKYISTILVILSIVMSIIVFAACGVENVDNSNSNGTSFSSRNTSNENDAGLNECTHTGGTATCAEQAICENCQEPYGEALSHTWDDATCTVAKTCSVCGETEGDPLGHSAVEEWASNEAGHYKVCKLHSEVTVEEGEHTDLSLDGLCDVCNYVVKAPTTFTVTVTSDFDAPIMDVEIALINGDDRLTLTTDENGVASGEFVYFESVSATLVTVPDGFVTERVNYVFEGSSLNIELTEVYTYNVYVLDENENGIKGAWVGFYVPFVNITTDENGLASFSLPRRELGNETQYLFVSFLPEGYVLCDAPFNEIIEIENNSTYIVHATLTTEFTLSAKDDSGNPLKNATFTFMKDFVEVSSVTTDQSGTVKIALPKGEYTVDISHLSAFFSCDTSSVTLNETNNSYEATFTESDEMELIWFNLVYADGSLPTYENTQIYVFLPNNFYYCRLMGINAKGQAAANAYNEDFYIYALDKDLNYAFGRYNKNDPTDIYLVMNEGVPAGSTEESAILAQALTDLPFALQDVYYSYEKQFVKGEYLYVKVLNALEKTVTINGKLFSLEYNGQEIAPNEDGIISLTFRDIPFGQDAVIKITAKEDAIEDLKVSCVGSEDNPIYVYSNETEDLTQNVKLLGAGHEIYFAFGNMDDTQYKLTVTSEGNDVAIEYVEGQIVDNYNYAFVKIIAKEEGTVTLTFTIEPYVQLKT